MDETRDGFERTHKIADNVVIETDFPEPVDFFRHLQEQRKVLHLLVFLFGASISFREHRVRDDSIASRLLSGETYEHPFAHLISSRTVKEHARPVPADDELARPFLVLDEIGPDGLIIWAEKYQEWERFILPAASVIGRSGRFIEDVVMSTSMSLEAAGRIIGERRGEAATKRGTKASVATYIYRCLDLLAINWGEHIHSQIGLARAIANNYNSVKHADRGEFPDHVETSLIGALNELVARLLAVELTGKGGELLASFRAGSAHQLWEIQQRFEINRVRIADDHGSWTAAL